MKFADLGDRMLAGNAYHALKDIVAISKEREWVGGWMNGLIPCVQVGRLNAVAK
jgi:predicted Zn-dependent protease